MHHLVHSWLMIILCAYALLLTGCAADRAAKTTSVSSWRYFDGNTWHTCVPATQQISVERRIAGTEQVMTEVIIIRQGASSAAELDEVARQMRGAQSDIKQIYGYVMIGDQTEKLTRRLRPQIIVHTKPNENIHGLCARHKARLIEPLSYSPNSYLVEPMDVGLFTAMTVAEHLQQDPAVIYAAPQIEQQRALKSR